MTDAKKDLVAMVIIFFLLLIAYKCTAQERRCMMTEENMQYFVYLQSNNKIEPFSENNCVTIHIETDYYTVQQFGGNTAAVRAWIELQWRQVDTLYENEGINISVTEIIIPTSLSWADTIPFGTIRDVLYQFGVHADDNVNGRFKHFMTMRQYGGGVAWLGGYCTRRNAIYGTGGIIGYYGAYAVSLNLDKEILPLSSNQWNASVLAHLMGHNCGLHHTHDCKWGAGDTLRIDSCYFSGVCDYATFPIETGSIMSYCHLSGNPGIDLLGVGFGTLPGDRLRNNLLGSGCFDFTPGLLTLSGLFSKYEYQADEILVTNGGNNKYLTLRAPLVTIEGPTNISPTFNIFQNGCN